MSRATDITGMTVAEAEKELGMTKACECCNGKGSVQIPGGKDGASDKMACPECSKFLPDDRKDVIRAMIAKRGKMEPVREPWKI